MFFDRRWLMFGHVCCVPQCGSDLCFGQVVLLRYSRHALALSERTDDRRSGPTLLRALRAARPLPANNRVPDGQLDRRSDLTSAAAAGPDETAIASAPEQRASSPDGCWS